MFLTDRVVLQTPPASYRQRVQQYHSLPRDRDPLREGGSPPAADSAGPTISATNGTALNNGISSKKGVAFGKGILQFVSSSASGRARAVGNRCSSTPNLGDKDVVHFICLLCLA